MTIELTSGSKDAVTRLIACPGCRKSTTWEGNPSRPFCSERCRLIDLGQWADEGYRIPVESLGSDEVDALDSALDEI